MSIISKLFSRRPTFASLYTSFISTKQGRTKQLYEVTERKLRAFQPDYDTMPVDAIHYDNGKLGNTVELEAGVEPTFDSVFAASRNAEWPAARQHALLLAITLRPDDADTIKERTARAFDYDIAVDAAKEAIAAFAASKAIENSNE